MEYSTTVVVHVAAAVSMNITNHKFKITSVQILLSLVIIVLMHLQLLPQCAYKFCTDTIIFLQIIIIINIIIITFT